MGNLATQLAPRESSRRWVWLSWLLNFLGGGIAPAVFMQDSLRVADQGTGVIRKVLPTHFNWPLFLIALALMSAPVLRQLLSLRRAPAPVKKPITLAQPANCA